MKQEIRNYNDQLEENKPLTAQEILTRMNEHSKRMTKFMKSCNGSTHDKEEQMEEALITTQDDIERIKRGVRTCEIRERFRKRREKEKSGKK